MRIAVDIGGTFTDLVAVDDRGQVYRSKSLTGTEDRARGIQDVLSGAEIDVAGANFVVHGSTVTINAVLERKGARTGLITTKGFRDVYEIGRGNRPEGYNMFFKRPVPLVSRDLRMEVNERLYASGELLQPLDDQSVMAAIDVLKSAGVESVAVCLLHSYANPIHEKRLGELLSQHFPEAYVSLSHEILREFREYERTSTTVLNSYVGPIVSRYLVSLEKMLGVVDLVEVGNGGGSIAWIDPAGGLKIGPQSAGASPGPACYGQGGTEPTVTDANLIVGRIDPEYFLGSGIRLQREKAAQAITEKIGQPLGLSLEEAALGILTIANFNMSLAVRAVSVEKGYDPRDCVLVPSGGGGALHAIAIARELSVPRVIIPPMPAHFSAFGMLLADLKHDYVQTFVRELSETTGAEIADVFVSLEKSATEILTEEGAAREQIVLRRFLDMRYRGQEYTLPVPINEDLRAISDFNAIRSRFDQLHQEHYGHSAPKEPVVMVNLRLSALGRFENRLSLASSSSEGGEKGERGKRRVIFDNGQQPVDCPIYLRSGFKAGDRLDGPAVIEEQGATILLYPGDKMRVNELGHLVTDVAS